MVSLWPWGSGSSSEPPKPNSSSSSWWPFSSSSSGSTKTSSQAPTKRSTSPPPVPSPSSVTQSKVSGVPELDILIAQADAKLNAASGTSPTVVAAASFALGGSVAVVLGFVYGRYGRRLRNSDWITPEWLGGRRWVRGVVTSVGDGDNFRLFHTPVFGGYHWPLKLRTIPNKTKDLKDETLHIRLAGVDAPENAHFGKPAQPHAAESLAWLTNQLLGKKVYCQLIRKDQYARIVAHVHRPYPFVPGFLIKGRNVSKWMLKTGNATVYEQAGAEYGSGGKEEYLNLEEKARKARKGQWAAKTIGESPAEYKRRHASMAASESVAPAPTKKVLRSRLR